MIKRPKYFILIVLFISGLQLAFNPSEKKIGIFEYLSQDSKPLDIYIETDFQLLSDERLSDTSRVGLLAFAKENGLKDTLTTTFELRGRFRRKTCSFPPLKLNFKKKELKQRRLKKWDKVKLVMQCIEDDEGMYLIYKEYLTYKLYSIVSPYSFRVQLLNINYKDTATGATGSMPGFIIESEEELGKRLNLKECELCFNRSMDEHNKENRLNHSMFQYMISNGDWSYLMVRNIKLFQTADKQYVTIPYDFDFSGLVKPSYAIPNVNIGQTNLKQRVYIGPKEDLDTLRETRSTFKSFRSEMFDLIRDFDRLPRRERNEMVNFLKTFYQELNEGIVYFPEQ